jgi:hypothetical protein
MIIFLPKYVFFLGTGDRRRLFVHADNAKADMAKSSKQLLEDHSLGAAPYSLDLPTFAPNDFLLFGYVKGVFQEAKFYIVEELFEAMVQILGEFHLIH